MTYRLLIGTYLLAAAIVLVSGVGIAFAGIGGPTGITVTASSTAYTVTTSSVALLASSTKRLAATIQPINCTTVGTLFLSDNDQTAVVRKGQAVYASSTLTMGDGQVPITNQGVRGVVDAGTCTVLVKEYLANF